ncbi:MAG: LPS assembly protein LptD [Pseudomonadota bacterium]
MTHIRALREKRLSNRKTIVVSSLLFSSVLINSPAYAQFSNIDQSIGFAGPEICKPGLILVPSEIKNGPDGDPSQLAIRVEADEIGAGSDDSIVLEGNAQVLQGKRGLLADQISYDQDSYIANAAGNVVLYTTNGTEIKAEDLELEVDTFIGSANNVNIRVADPAPPKSDRKHGNFDENYSLLAPFRTVYVTGSPHKGARDENIYVRARANADRMDFEGEGFERLTNTTFTTCAEGNNDVLLQASEIELDHDTGIGTAKNMTLRFKGVPIFYFPTATFPINNERKTGFLFPSVGYDDDSGFILQVPYYINIAPQHDATITPKLLTDRGIQLYTEYRHLGENSRTELRGEFLPSDDQFEEEDRYAVGLDHQHRFGTRWNADVDLQTVSDSDYLRDFSNDVDVVASSFVQQRAELRYNSPNLRFEASTQTFDIVNDQITESSQPYEILPRLALDVKPYEFGLFETGLDSEFTNFAHEDNARVTGTRLRLKPYLSVPYRKIFGYVEPKLSVQSISYSLDDNPTGDESPSVSVPIFSVDSGLYFDREFKRGAKLYSQSLEPRLFYLNIPDKLEQEDFPNFDTGGGSNSSYGHFFRENRFFGGDRVGDTHQVSFGVTSRITEEDTGRQRLSMSIGQVFFFDDREVGLTADSDPETESTSDIIGEITANINVDWRLSAFARFDQEESEMSSYRFSADYDHSSRRNASISYTRTGETAEQINIDFETPLAAHWQFAGRAAYSLEDSELRSSRIGISYDGCCWATRLESERYLDGTGEYRNRVLVTLEFDDLGRIRSRL